MRCRCVRIGPRFWIRAFCSLFVRPRSRDVRLEACDEVGSYGVEESIVAQTDSRQRSARAYTRAQRGFRPCLCVRRVCSRLRGLRRVTSGSSSTSSSVFNRSYARPSARACSRRARTSIAFIERTNSTLAGVVAPCLISTSAPRSRDISFTSSSFALFFSAAERSVTRTRSGSIRVIRKDPRPACTFTLTKHPSHPSSMAGIDRSPARRLRRAWFHRVLRCAERTVFGSSQRNASCVLKDAPKRPAPPDVTLRLAPLRLSLQES